ncbi:TetR/AcrR family transcriptional regulator [Halopseudomonas sp. SMJS2]|uniref:TetR/AcrR family transcriptional regulator n=1 Tax=Halopseudomonas sp. SMJS2 TaxID=3041098 RepID=UPI002452CEF6|nr:TetR/AcrR family transcriptional regulator [Halopseudomonas sp. SMJS2]WGK60716.1 TetR/AcrR family transcriptional regulator [Halopseudomonas sp. SMJS2]
MTPDTEETLLRSLALTLTENPGATLQEMAKAAGVSRATLYRFAATREQLFDTLQQHVMAAMSRILDDAGLESQSPLDALRQLITGYIAQREFCVFMITQFEPYIKRNTQQAYPDECLAHEQRLDDFFLRGQQLAIFRPDVPCRWLTDLFFGFIYMLCESEYRGRIARADMQRLFEDMFLNGALARPA